MSRQFHYVVVANVDDDNTITYVLDDDTAIMRFNDELVWDTEMDTWRAISTDEEALDQNIGAQLRYMIGEQEKEES